MVLSRGIVTMSTRVGNLLRATFNSSSVIRNITLPTIITRGTSMGRRPIIRRVVSPHGNERLLFRLISLANNRGTATPRISTRSKLPMFRQRINLIRSNTVPTSNRSSVHFFRTFLLQRVLRARHITRDLRINLRRRSNAINRRSLHNPLQSTMNRHFTKIK